ncbi:MAG TPA: hypothetical protein VGJ56_24710 [Reyranella sp.]|jgi:hypothetical protein
MGKWPVGLRVITERISFARSTGLCFAKIVSGLLEHIRPTGISRTDIARAL